MGNAKEIDLKNFVWRVRPGASSGTLVVELYDVLDRANYKDHQIVFASKYDQDRAAKNVDQLVRAAKGELLKRLRVSRSASGPLQTQKHHVVPAYLKGAVRDDVAEEAQPVRLDSIPPNSFCVTMDGEIISVVKELIPMVFRISPEGEHRVKYLPGDTMVYAVSEVNLDVKLA